MRQEQDDKEAVKKAVRDIKRRTRRKFSPEEKIRIVLQGLRGEDSIAELCRREGLHQNQYDRWSKEFLEAGRQRLAGDIEREATSDEVKTLREPPSRTTVLGSIPNSRDACRSEMPSALIFEMM